MKRSEYFLGKYMNSHLRELIKNQSDFLDEIVQKYLKAVCRQFPVDDRCIDNLLRIKNFKIEPIGIGENGRAGVLVEDFDEKNLVLKYELKLFPNIDTAFLKNEIPEGLAGEDLKNYKYEVMRHIVIFLHELTHAMNFVEFLKYDEEKYTNLTKEDTSKENYTYYIAHGGLISNRIVVSANIVENALNINKNYIYEALTEFIAHNVLLDDGFSDIQYFYIDNKKIDPYHVNWTYSPFVNIVFVLKYLFNEAFSMAYFTGETKISGFDKSCLNIYITNISEPISMIIKNYAADNFDMQQNVETLVKGIKEFLSFIEKSLEREDVKKYLDDYKIDCLNEEIKNVCNYNCYLKFIIEDSNIDEKSIDKLKNILEGEFKNLEPLNVFNDVINLDNNCSKTDK